MDGHTLVGVEAAGKLLRLRFDGDVVVVSHLRMNGRWRLLPPGAAPGGNAWLALRTPVGTAVQLNGPVLRLERHPARQAPDLLADGSDPELLAGRLRLADPGRLLAEVLQDQALVGGIGNMWAAEALWATGLHPLLPVGQATDDELGRVLEWARTRMRQVTTGRRPPRAVYRRVGRPCPRCGAPISASGVGDANRTAYRCDACQRLAPPPAHGA